MYGVVLLLLIYGSGMQAPGRRPIHVVGENEAHIQRGAEIEGK